MYIDKRSIKKILVLRYRSVEEIILTGPALEALTLTFPNARIDMVADEDYADLLHGNQHINYVLLFQRERGEMSRFQHFKQKARFIGKIRKQKYDLVVDFHNGPESAWLSLFSGARYRLGRRYRFKNRLAFNIPAPVAPPGLHLTDALLQTLEPLGPEMPEEKNLFLKCREEDEAYISGFMSKFGLTEHDFVAVIHPGASMEEKRLPAEKMGAVARWLVDELGMKVVYSGDNEDIAEISEIVKFSGRRGLVATNLSFGRLAGLIGASHLFLGNDGGPMHMASALGLPVVAFFGPSDPNERAPVGEKTVVLTNSPLLDCQPCDQKNCNISGNHCMTKIKINDIKRAITGLFSDHSARRV